MKRKPVIYIAFLLLMVSGLSCSTKKNTFTRRVYHNLTGHYNMFWNGRESYREALIQLNKTVKDNYNKLLPVYNYGTEQEAQALAPYLDKAIEKASLNIQDHSMYFNRREYVNWIDDSFLLIGKAYFYKQEYHKARRTFEYVSNEYKYNDIKYEALLWLAKSYIELEQYNRASSTLDNLSNELDKASKPPAEVLRELPVVEAHLLLKEEKYDQAEEALRTALLMRQERILDARLRFILAQIYQQKGEFYAASDYYRQVIKKRPPYEMAFNAAINLAQSYDARYGESSRDIVKNLRKMLREDKNKDFRDQIYYALADVSFKDSLDSLAIGYLRLSVASSVNNDYQKVKSSLLLGDIYFSHTKYELAQAYYDTAVQVMPEDFPDKEEIEVRTRNLTDLVHNLQIVQMQDSLQRLARMDEEERNKIFDKIIADLIEEEERQKEQEELAQLQMLAGNTPTGTTGMSAGANRGAWYFYNPAALSSGFTEFKKRWGNRKLEDNWRLSNKQPEFKIEEKEAIALAETDSLLTDSAGVALRPDANDPHTREYYLKDLPLTEARMKASNGQIMNALFNLGMIYMNQLEDLPNAIASFDTLLARFPGSEHEPEALYYLNRMWVKLGNEEKAEQYKELLVNNYPDTDYARLLTDPDFFASMMEQKNRAQRLYDETWQHYLSGNYYTVYSNTTRALKEFREPAELLPRFAYLRALALGRIEVTDSLQAALENLIKTYPQSEVVPLAENILNYLKAPADSLLPTGTSGKKEEPKIDYSIYTFSETSKQLFAIVASGQGFNVNALKIRISDFNKKFFSLANLTITNLMIDKTTHLVMVGNFDTVEEAMRYYNTIMSNEYVFSNMQSIDYEGFIITQENYPVLYKDKDLARYMAFFRDKYLRQ